MPTGLLIEPNDGHLSPAVISIGFPPSFSSINNPVGILSPCPKYDPATTRNIDGDAVAINDCGITGPVK